MSGVSLKLENDVSNIAGLQTNDEILHFPLNELYTRLNKKTHLEPTDGTSNSETVFKTIENIQRMYNPHPTRGYHISTNKNSIGCSHLRNTAHSGDPNAQFVFAVNLITKTCGTDLEGVNDWMSLLEQAANSGHKNAKILYDFFNTNHEENSDDYREYLRNDPAKLLKIIFNKNTRNADTAARRAASNESLGKVLPKNAAASKESLSSVLTNFKKKQAAAKAASAKAAAAEGGKRRKRTRRTTRKFLKKRSTRRKR